MLRLILPALVFLAACKGQGEPPLETASFQTTQSKPYEEFKTEIIATRDQIREQYLAADSAKRDSLINYSSAFLRNITQELFTYWYGTEWDFNGITQTPKKGKIACGYFVTTLIRDAGFNIPRSTWAQLPSESFIKKVQPTVKRFSNKPIESVIKYLKEKPDAIYVVGMDTHVGFLCKEGKSLKFIHSNYYYPEKGVMSENLKGNNPVNDASYRVIGQIYHADMAKKWILGEVYE